MEHITLQEYKQLQQKEEIKKYFIRRKYGKQSNS